MVDDSMEDRLGIDDSLVNNNITEPTHTPTLLVPEAPVMVRVISRLNRAIPITYDGEGTMLPPRSPRIFDKAKLGPLPKGVFCTVLS